MVLRSEHAGGYVEVMSPGEEDAFAWAERHAREYEVYSAKMDMTVDDVGDANDDEYDS